MDGMDARERRYQIEVKADDISSNSDNFTIEDISNETYYYPTDIYYSDEASHTITRRTLKDNERAVSNRTLARLVFQIFEERFVNMSEADKEWFQTGMITTQEGETKRTKTIHGIFPSEEAFKEKYPDYNCVEYMRENGEAFYIYCAGPFSNLEFAHECLKRFGQPADKFVLEYRDKTEEELQKYGQKKARGAKNSYAKILKQSKNIILRGAPGTGKTFLAKAIAAEIVSGGKCTKYSELTEEQKEQIEFVQFHPSYDYSDFVEGLRPKLNPDGSMGFELQPGIFTRFVTKARENLENSQKSQETVAKEVSADAAIEEFLDSVEFGVDEFETAGRGNKFKITASDDKHIYISIPANDKINTLTLYTKQIRTMLESGKNFEKGSELKTLFGRKVGQQSDSYVLAIYKKILERQEALKAQSDSMQEMQETSTDVTVEKKKNYVFIIDEINRGEISKILGELFFSIDPGYRGEEGSVSTQYANMHEDPTEKFYIPENVYIIGTMNDIDRSVDSFDFAMRRRFRFLEVTAEDSMVMLQGYFANKTVEEEACRRMKALNDAILQVEDLNSNYQIGAAYFRKIKEMHLTFDELWTDSLYPVLLDYVRGMYDEEGIMKQLARAYGYPSSKYSNREKPAAKELLSEEALDEDMIDEEDSEVESLIAGPLDEETVDED